jgi:hypothetical protein
MKKIKHESQEIVSFNTAVPAVPALIELDDGALDLVTGGQFHTEFCGIDNCGENDFSCGVNNCKRNVAPPLPPG